MDVHCSTCGEAWDVYHLRKEVVFETGLSSQAARTWCFLPPSEKLSNRYRKEFEAAGWEFGTSVMNVIHCPCCPKDAKPNPERVQTKAALEQLLGGDEDGLAAMFEDYNL